MKRLHRYVLAVPCAAALGGAANAATTCVTSSAQLAAAIVAAQNNNQDDVIYLEVGNYPLSAELGYYAAPAEAFKLSIIGGMAPGCASGFASSGDSVIDGQNLVRPLTISAHGEVDLGRLTFQNGKPAQYFGGALNVATSAGNIYIFDSTFAANQTAAGNGGGAMYVSAAPLGDIYLWSNVLLANSASGGSAIYLNGTHNSYLTGNTILANTLINHAGLGAVDIAGSGYAFLSNNILWNNEAYDVYDQVGMANFANNDIGVKGGFTPLSESNDLSVDPGFSGFLSLRPGPASPLVNAGTDSPPGGVGGCCDAGGAARVQGKHVDIGAYETDVLFRDAFGS